MFKIAKKLLAVILIFVTAMSVSCICANAAIENPVYVNGTRIKLPSEPIEIEDCMLVPARAVYEALHCTVSWIPETETAIIENPVTIISVKIGQYNLTKKDRNSQENIIQVPMPVAARYHNDSLYVPVRAISEAMHAEVKWINNREIHINTQFDFIGEFYEDVARASKNGKYGFIDANKNTVIPFEFEDAISFSEGLAAVKKGGKWGFIDKTGKVVIDFKYTNAWLFNEGLAGVALYNKWGFIDKHGKEVIEFKYSETLWFSEGLCAVKNIGGDWGYIDKKGKMKIPFIYDEAKSFANGRAWVVNSKREYYINKSGDKVQ